MAHCAYDVFGFRWHSERPLPLPIASRVASPDLTVAFDPADDAWISSIAGQPVTFSSPSLDLQASATGQLLRFLNRATGEPAATFAIRTETITCRVRDAAQYDMVPLWLLGPVSALWLENRGLPVLHGSAVHVDDHAIAFLSHSRAGKSGLAAACMQAGHALLADDMVAIDARGGAALARPGFPQMRMWPDAAAHFTGDFAHLPRVQPLVEKRRVPVGPGGFGAFCETPLPLARLYLPRRRDADAVDQNVTITPIHGAEALVELLRYGFAAPVLKLRAQRELHLRVLGELAARVPLRRLDYPAGFRHLPAVHAAIMRDLAG